MSRCASPAIITKDLAMLVYGRDGRLGPRLKHLFQGTFRNPEANKLTGVYEIAMKRAAIGSPGITCIETISNKFIEYKKDKHFGRCLTSMLTCSNLNEFFISQGFSEDSAEYWIHLIRTCEERRIFVVGGPR